jgi:hypothetical protein
MNKQSTEVTGVTLTTDTGAAESRTAGTAGITDNADAGADEGRCSSTEDSHAPDNARLLDRGVELHALSADEGASDDTDEEMDERDLTPEEAAAATAALDGNHDDQEGLALTGGDWFNTIKQVAKNNKEAEKELAARMKKAKISQTSLENEVFEGEPSNHSSADAGPGLTPSKKMDPDLDLASGLDPDLDLKPEPDPEMDPDLDWDPVPDPPSDPDPEPTKGQK